MSSATMTNPFSKRVSSGEGGDFELPPSGTYPACLVALIDLGMQRVTFNNETKEQPKIFLVWELTGEHDSKGQPFYVGKDFTFSLNSKAKLRAFLEGWSGRKFADDEEIDVSVFLNQNCVVNVTEGISGSGKKYVDVASATKPMKGLTVPPRSVEPFAWSFDGWDPKNEPPIPEWVPFTYGRKIIDEIKKAREWSSLVPF
jgi:hypothetical protein